MEKKVKGRNYTNHYFLLPSMDVQEGHHHHRKILLCYLPLQMVKYIYFHWDLGELKNQSMDTKAQFFLQNGHLMDQQ